MYHYEWTPQARQEIKKLSPDIQERIIDKLNYFLSSPNPLTLAKRLKHFEGGQYRFRVGDYRIIFDVEDDTIVVLALGHRRDIYT